MLNNSSKLPLGRISDHSANQTLNIRVLNRGGTVAGYKINRNDQVSKLMNAFKSSQNIAKVAGEIRFHFNGKVIKPTDTPQTLGMKDFDPINVEFSNKAASFSKAEIVRELIHGRVDKWAALIASNDAKYTEADVNKHYHFETPIELNGGDLQAVAKALEKNTHVTTLCLQYHSIRDDVGVAALARAIGKSKTIKVLKLAGNKFTKAGMDKLAAAIAQNRVIEELHIGDWEEYAPKYFKMITSIVRHSSIIRVKLNIFFSELFEGSGGAKYAKKARNALYRLTGQESHLKELYLESSGITDNEAEQLAKGLEENNTIELLNLEDNNIGSQGGIYLAAGISKNETLVELNLKMSKIGDPGATAFLNAFKSNSSLKKLNLGWNKITPEILAKLRHVLRPNAIKKRALAKQRAQRLVEELPTKVTKLKHNTSASSNFVDQQKFHVQQLLPAFNVPIPTEELMITEQQQYPSAPILNFPFLDTTEEFRPFYDMSATDFSGNAINSSLGFDMLQTPQISQQQQPQQISQLQQRIPQQNQQQMISTPQPDPEVQTTRCTGCNTLLKFSTVAHAHIMCPMCGTVMSTTELSQMEALPVSAVILSEL